MKQRSDVAGERWPVGYQTCARQRVRLGPTSRRNRQSNRRYAINERPVRSLLRRWRGFHVWTRTWRRIRLGRRARNRSVGWTMRRGVTVLLCRLRHYQPLISPLLSRLLGRVSPGGEGARRVRRLRALVTTHTRTQPER